MGTAPSPVAGGLPARFAPAAAAATAVAAGALWLRAGFVDRQIATTQLIVIELCDCLLRILVGTHLDERKPTRAARGHVAHDVHAVNRPGLGEERLEVLF